MMAKEEKTRETIKRLRKAGFTRRDAKGSHSKWTHPSGAWVIIADGHRTTSPGVVHKVDKAIKDAETSETAGEEQDK